MNKKLKKAMMVGLTAITSLGMAVGLTACGKDGNPGGSAYDIAVANGFEGTEAEWLASLKGQDGAVADVLTISEDGYWMINGVKTDTPATGPRGDDGNDGVAQGIGIDPRTGNWVLDGEITQWSARGQSVYEIFCDLNGYNSTVSQWLTDYVQGQSAFKVWANAQPVAGSRPSGSGIVNGYNTDDFFASIVGASAFELWAQKQPTKPDATDGNINGYSKADYIVTDAAADDFVVWAFLNDRVMGGKSGVGTMNGYDMTDFANDCLLPFGDWANSQPTKPRQGVDSFYGYEYINGYSITEFFSFLVGDGIVSVDKQSNKNLDTITVTYTNGEIFTFSFDFTVANGKSALEEWAYYEGRPWGGRGAQGVDTEYIKNGYNITDLLNSIGDARFGTIESKIAELEKQVAFLAAQNQRNEYILNSILNGEHFQIENGLIQQEVTVGAGQVWAYLYTADDPTPTIPHAYYLDITGETPILKQNSTAYGAEPEDFATKYLGETWGGVMKGNAATHGYHNNYTGEASTDTAALSSLSGGYSTIAEFRAFAEQCNIIITGDNAGGTITYAPNITWANIKAFCEGTGMNFYFFRRTWTYSVDGNNITLTGVMDSEGSLVCDRALLDGAGDLTDMQAAVDANGYFTFVHYELTAVQ